MPMFKTEQERLDFRNRHRRQVVRQRSRRRRERTERPRDVEHRELDRLLDRAIDNDKD